MRHRVRLKRIGRAWLRGDALPINDGGADDGEVIDQILPAIGETANRVRVVVEEDDARVAVWIDRRDAWETVVAPVRLRARRRGAAGGSVAHDGDRQGRGGPRRRGGGAAGRLARGGRADPREPRPGGRAPGAHRRAA